LKIYFETSDHITKVFLSLLLVRSILPIEKEKNIDLDHGYRYREVGIM